MNKPLNWAEAISICHQGKQGFVLATVLETKGSTPRDRGAKMVVTEDAVFDTIGGGKLEQLVIDAAREALKLKVKTQQLEHFPLAGKAQQCCGGSVAVLPPGDIGLAPLPNWLCFHDEHFRLNERHLQPGVDSLLWST